MSDVETVKPADAALLRELADDAEGEAEKFGRYGDVPQYVEQCRTTAARLRALADVLERVQNARAIQINVYPDGSVDAFDVYTSKRLGDLSEAVHAIVRDP